jgi:hypothetical protein
MAPEFGKTSQDFNEAPQSVVASEAKKDEIQRFSPEQREALEEMGYKIYELTEKSIKDLREAGNSFWSTWHQGQDFEGLKSIRSEVAVDPSRLFLPGSDNKTLSEQESLVAKFSKNISAKIPGVKAIIGEVSDYAELAFLSPVEHRLFGRDYGYDCTRTQTRTHSGVVEFGGNKHYDRLLIWYSASNSRKSNLFVAPLIVPAESK